MAKVIILCGKIASGKTYYASKLKKDLNAVILSVDDLILKLFDSCLGDKHDDMIRRCENYLYTIAEQLVEKNINTIIDYGFWNKEERLYAKEYFNQKGILAEIHFIDAEEKLRLLRLKKRNDKLKDDIKNNTKKDRVFIIEEDLRQKLDKKFEKPDNLEIDLYYKNN